jgi:hypothetical protein
MTQKLPHQGPMSEPVEPRFKEEHESTRASQYNIGIKKYGIPLRTFNGRSAHTDVMQEYIDMGRYLTQMQMEREVLEGLLRESHAFMKTLILPFSRQQQLADMLGRLDQVFNS